MITNMIIDYKYDNKYKNKKVPLSRKDFLSELQATSNMVFL